MTILTYIFLPIPRSWAIKPDAFIVIRGKSIIYNIPKLEGSGKALAGIYLAKPIVGGHFEVGIRSSLFSRHFQIIATKLRIYE